MDADNSDKTTNPKNPTAVERTSDCEVVVTRVVSGPVRLVYEAWTRADLFRKWWVPKSAGLTLLSCEMDVKVGGGYRLVFAFGEDKMAFFGTYLEVVPLERIVWTNEEAGEAGQITTVTFEDRGEQTLVRMHERYPSKAALDENISCGAQEGTTETFDQLDEFVRELVARAV